MDDFTAEVLASGQDNTRAEQQAQPQVDDEPPTPRRGIRASKASLQDRLVEKLLQQVIPVDDHGADGPLPGADQTPSAFAERPNFNLTTMSNNFRRFNARIGVVFKFQARVLRLLSWREPTQTASLLAVYTFVCLDPYLAAALPMAILVLGALVPGFLARHPAPPEGTLSSEQGLGYSAGGPPLAPAKTVRPVKELSRDFFRNMRDLQNVMEDFSVGHDQVVALLVPLTNFSDEALSSAVFLVLVVSGVALTVTAHLVPWRLIALAVGWAAICSGHPGVARLLAAAHREHVQPRGDQALSLWDGWVASDVMLDSAPEAREVEVFELQRMADDGGEWEPWLFTPSPYDPLSQPRIAGDRPRGTRFFDDVAPPEGWQWSEKKWALDLWSREWVEERIITGVEVETEGERWVYDMYDERRDQTGVVEAPEAARPRAPLLQPSWEEGEDSVVRRGEWRRRRWVRLVKRRVTPAPEQY